MTLKEKQKKARTELAEAMRKEWESRIEKLKRGRDGWKAAYEEERLKNGGQK